MQPRESDLQGALTGPTLASPMIPRVQYTCVYMVDMGILIAYRLADCIAFRLAPELSVCFVPYSVLTCFAVSRFTIPSRDHIPFGIYHCDPYSAVR